MDCIFIDVSGIISLKEVSQINFQLPYARKFNLLNYYYVWEDGDKEFPINLIASKLTGFKIEGDIYILKSDKDITGISFEMEECIPCNAKDLETLKEILK